MLITEEADKAEILIVEASKSVVIETFKTNLTKDTSKEIHVFPSISSFKFGDGQKVTAIKRIFS